jgi:hypothetical protein
MGVAVGAGVSVGSAVAVGTSAAGLQAVIPNTRMNKAVRRKKIGRVGFMVNSFLVDLLE